MSRGFSDSNAEPRIFEPAELGRILTQGLADADPDQKTVAILFDLSQDSITKWKKGEGLKAQQFSLLFWLARRSATVRRWVCDAVGLPVDSIMDDNELAPIARALVSAKQRTDWPEVRRTISTQLRWLGVYDEGERLPLAAEAREKYGGA